MTLNNVLLHFSVLTGIQDLVLIEIQKRLEPLIGKCIIINSIQKTGFDDLFIDIGFKDERGLKKEPDSELNSVKTHQIISRYEGDFSLLFEALNGIIGIESYAFVLHKCKTEDIFSKRLDGFRLREEIVYGLTSTQSNVMLKRLLKDNNSYTFDNTSIITRNFHFTDKDKRQIDNIALKILDELKLLNLKSEHDKSKRDIIFKIWLDRDSTSFMIEFHSNLFLNLMPYSSILRHITPLSPEIAMAMMIAPLRKLQNLRSAPNNTQDRHYIFIVDPFCGYGTIPMVAFTQIDFIQKLISEYNNNVQNLDLKKLKQNDRFQIIGYDRDESAISNCIKNRSLIEEYYQNKDIFLAFSIKNINEFAQDLLDRIQKSTEKGFKPFIFIVTQPPYGFTKHEDEDALIHLYENLIDSSYKLSLNYPVILTVITGRPILVKNAVTTFKDRVGLLDHHAFIERMPTIKEEYGIKKSKITYTILILEFQ